jgi:hypothetical protein
MAYVCLLHTARGPDDQLASSDRYFSMQTYVENELVEHCHQPTVLRGNGWYSHPMILLGCVGGQIPP